MGETLGREPASECCVHAEPCGLELRLLRLQAPWPCAVPAGALVLLSLGTVPTEALVCLREGNCSLRDVSGGASSSLEPQRPPC